MSKFYKGCGPQKLGCAVKLDGSNGHEGGAPFINPGIATKMAKGVIKAKQIITDKAKEYDAKDGKKGNTVSQFINDAGKVIKTAGKVAAAAGGAPFKGANASNSKCWPGYEKQGTKESPTRPGVRVNNCVKK